MRLLQELVPGCNKITGKAVMLDEIINYVQSLQQQVEVRTENYPNNARFLKRFKLGSERGIGFDVFSFYL